MDLLRGQEGRRNEPSPAGRKKGEQGRVAAVYQRWRTVRRGGGGVRTRGLILLIGVLEEWSGRPFGGRVRAVRCHCRSAGPMAGETLQRGSRGGQGVVERVGEMGQSVPVRVGLSGSGCPRGMHCASAMASNGARAMAGGAGPGVVWWRPPQKGRMGRGRGTCRRDRPSRAPAWHDAGRRDSQPCA
jgi:hypothetical protein